MSVSERVLALVAGAAPEHLLALLVALPLLLLLAIGAGWRAGYWKRRAVRLESRTATLEERLSQERHHADEKIELLNRVGTAMQAEFKNLAQDIFEEKSRHLSHLNSERLDSLLQPFREQLRLFTATVEHAFLEETRDHASLKQEIVQLRQLNQQINEEAANLARAISGNKKSQGDWGEMVLERLLEQSGLRRGHEYLVQTVLRDADHRLYRPDVIIRLPEQRDIVIDSKVSLAAWSRYIVADDEAERRRALHEHIGALRQHLKDLAGKDYRSLPDLRSLDFVLMFVPIDAAFITAVQHEESLVGDMYARKVIVVTPTTLFAALRTIEHFWQIERQNKHAQEIAERAGILYDKLVGFLEDMERLGRQIDTCKDTYDKAMTKICRGRGNLLDQASRFPRLGVKVKAELPKSFTDKVDA